MKLWIVSRALLDRSGVRIRPSLITRLVYNVRLDRYNQSKENC